MNWRDYTSIFSIVFVLVIIGAIVFKIPVVQQIGDWHWATVLLTILGALVFVTVSPLFAPTSKPESLSVALFGATAAILAVIGWFVNSQLLFLGLCINLAVLWTLATVYHIQERPHKI